MRVELPQLLSIMAHELRSPLGVLQGYIRLLQRQRKQDDPEHAMLTAMLDSTGRMTAITREASELAAWLRRQPELSEEAIDVATLAGRVREKLDPGAASVTVDGTGPTATTWTTDANLLGSALAAIARSAARDSGAEQVAVNISEEDAAILVSIRAAATPPSSGAAVAGDGAFAFDRGGLGLALVVASYVLEGHGAGVTRTVPSGIIEIRLKKNRGHA